MILITFTIAIQIQFTTVNITEDEKVVEEDVILFKPMEFSKSYSPNNDSNESINLWNKLPDEIVETVLLNAIGSSSKQRNSKLSFHNANMF